MIRPIDIRLNAAHPDLPLAEAVTYTGAPSTVLIRGVPGNCGRWAITAVFVAATFPDGSTTTRTAVQSANGVWVATLPATATSGRTAHGLRILADGADENGEAVGGYVLGVADFAVASLAVTPAPEPGETSWQMLYFDALPDPAKKGDVTRIDGDLKFYNGAEWLPFTDLSDYYTAEQVDEAIDKLAAYYITADAQGNPFATYAALVNASVYYSGGAVRIPTRNDYAVVSADETHGGAEWRYIYAADAQGAGQWEPQYAVEGVIAYDDAVTRTSGNGVKSSGIWSALWGALTALPAGLSSLYDWIRSFFARPTAIAPTWDASHDYHVGDVCIESEVAGSSGLLYRCIKSYRTDSESDGPSHDTEHWEEVDVNTLLGSKVPMSRTINSRPLSADVTLTGADIPLNPTPGAPNLNSVVNTLTTQVYDAQTSANNAGVAAVAANNKIDAHAADTNIHVTTTDKANWSGKADRAANPTSGNLAALDANGNPTDAGYRLAVRNGIPCIIQTAND